MVLKLYFYILISKQIYYFIDLFIKNSSTNKFMMKMKYPYFQIVKYQILFMNIFVQTVLKRELQSLYEMFEDEGSVLLPYNPGLTVSGVDTKVIYSS